MKSVHTVASFLILPGHDYKSVPVPTKLFISWWFYVWKTILMEGNISWEWGIPHLRFLGPYIYPSYKKWNNQKKFSFLKDFWALTFTFAVCCGKVWPHGQITSNSILETIFTNFLNIFFSPTNYKRLLFLSLHKNYCLLLFIRTEWTIPNTNTLRQFDTSKLSNFLSNFF